MSTSANLARQELEKKRRNHQANSAEQKIQESRSETNSSRVKQAYPINVSQMRQVVFTAYDWKANVKGESQEEKKDGKSKPRSVTLPLPAEVSTDFAAEWSAEELMSQTDKGTWKQILGVGGKAIQQGLSGAGDATGLRKQTEINIGSTVNPNLELAYVSHGLVSIDYTYMLVPKNEDEAKAIQQIKRFFQRESHPTSGGSRMQYPSKFDIVYQEPDGDRMHTITQMLTCSLTNVSIVENGHGESAFIKGSDGTSYPSVTAITLSFQERRMRFREDF